MVSISVSLVPPLVVLFAGLLSSQLLNEAQKQVLDSLKNTVYYAGLGKIDRLQEKLHEQLQFGLYQEQFQYVRNGTVAFDPNWLHDRRRLQGRWEWEEKGWTVPLTWGPAPRHGGPNSLGVYSVGWSVEQGDSNTFFTHIFYTFYTHFTHIHV